MANWKDVRTLYARELRSALRERTIVVNSILLPIFLYPLMLWLVYTGISFVSGQTEGFSSRVMLEGLPAEHQTLREELEAAKQMKVLASPDPLADIREGRLDALAEFLPSKAAAPALPGDFSVRITYDDSKDRSRIARERVEDRVRRYRDYVLGQQAAGLGIDASALQAFWVTTKNVATGRQMGQFILGLMLPMFLIIMLSVGCMYPAIDSTAGEREKSTWETLMTTAAARSDIVLAKYLYVATMASVAGLLNITAMVLSMKSVLAPLAGRGLDTMSFRIPLAALPLIALVTVLLALFIAAGMMILASFARTFKEGQSMVTPFYLATLLPVMFLQVPGIEFTPVLALIPVVNVAMVFREAVGGLYHWPEIAITIAVEGACVALALRVATLILRHEDLMLGSYQGKFGKFLKERVLRSAKGGGGGR